MKDHNSLQLKSFFGYLEQLDGELSVSTSSAWDKPDESFFSLGSSERLRCGDPMCDGTPSLADFLDEMEPLKEGKTRTFPCPGYTGAQRCRRSFKVRVTAIQAREQK
jgi:hypothetical protein